MINKKIFFRFLKENGIYEIFFKRLDGRNISFSDIQIFNHCITWDNTKEGYFFWKYIQLEYLLILYNFYRNLEGNNTQTINIIKQSFLKIRKYSSLYCSEHDKKFKYYINKIKNIYNVL